jgi:outer membrane protein
MVLEESPSYNRNRFMRTTTTTTRRITMVLGLACGALAPWLAHAGDSPWLLRLRAVQIDSANKDSTGLDLSINNKVIPEVDVSYFFTPQIAAELVLTYPQKHTIRAGGSAIGSLRHLPPTLTLQYHATDWGPFKPYVGAGINYTRFSSVQFDAATEAALHPSLEKSSVGAAVQAGFDVEVMRDTVLNVDVKKVQIRTDVRSSGNRVGEFKVDPWLIGIGVGHRF